MKIGTNEPVTLHRVTVDCADENEAKKFAKFCRETCDYMMTGYVNNETYLYAIKHKMQEAQTLVDMHIAQFTQG